MKLNDGLFSQVHSKTKDCPKCKELRARIAQCQGSRNRLAELAIKEKASEKTIHRMIPAGVLNNCVHAYATHLRRVHKLALEVTK